MRLAAMVRALVERGGTPEQILALVEAFEATNEDALAKRRENDAARQRKRRESHVMSRESRDVTVTVRDKRDKAEKPNDFSGERAPARVVETSTSSDEEVLKEEREEKKPSPPARPARWPDDGFDQWWAVYPRREAKGAAERAWRAMVKRNDATFEAVMARTRDFARAPPEAAFCPHPATWLNGKRYLDEFQPSRPAPERFVAGDRPRQPGGVHAVAAGLALFEASLDGRPRQAEDPGLVDLEPYPAAGGRTAYR